MVAVKMEKVEAIKASKSSRKSRKRKGKGGSSKKVSEEEQNIATEVFVDVTSSDTSPEKKQKLPTKGGKVAVVRSVERPL